MSKLTIISTRAPNTFKVRLIYMYLKRGESRKPIKKMKMKMIKKFTIVPNSKAYWEFINSRPPLTLHINYKKKIKVIT